MLNIINALKNMFKKMEDEAYYRAFRPKPSPKGRWAKARIAKRCAEMSADLARQQASR
jgi:hypothetical protein